jgi:hypothetical protein
MDEQNRMIRDNIFLAVDEQIDLAEIGGLGSNWITASQLFNFKGRKKCSGNCC